DQPRAYGRWTNVTCMSHPWQLHVHSPFQGTVHFAWDVVALWGLPDYFEILNTLHRSAACRRIDVVPCQCDIETLSADELSVGHAFGRIDFHGDHAIADRELIHGNAKPHGRHFQQYTPCFSRDATHRQAVRLDGIGSARAPL